MTKIDRNKLRDLAMAATPGEWLPPHFSDETHSCNCLSVVGEDYNGAIATIHVDNGKPVSDGGNDCPPAHEAKANGAYIAAANPKNMIALLDQIDWLEAENEALTKTKGITPKALSDKGKQVMTCELEIKILRRVETLEKALSDADTEYQANLTERDNRIDALEAELALHENEDASYTSELNSTRSALVDAETRIATLEHELSAWKSVFPDISPESVQPDRSLLEQRIATLEARETLEGKQ